MEFIDKYLDQATGGESTPVEFLGKIHEILIEELAKVGETGNLDTLVILMKVDNPNDPEKDTGYGFMSFTPGTKGTSAKLVLDMLVVTAQNVQESILRSEVDKLLGRNE